MDYSQFESKLLSKKHIIWDWNGTILNDIDYAVKTLETLLSSQNLPPITVEKYKAIFGFPIKDFYGKLGLSYEKTSFEELCDQFVSAFMSNISSCKPFIRVLTIIKQLHDHGRAQSVLSATDQENLDKMIKHFELLPYFKNVYGLGDKFAASKVQRGQELMKVSDFKPEDTIMIGDTLHDLEVGNSLGIEVALITHGHQEAQRLAAKHDGVYSIIS